MSGVQPVAIRRGRGVVCAGGAVLDRHLHLLAPAVSGTSNPARAVASPGGVARNVAENLALLGIPVRLVSRVGADDAGRELLRGLGLRGVDTEGVVVAPGEPTAQYVAVLDPAGELVIGIAAMDVLDGIALPDLVAVWPRAGEWLLLDCNLPTPVLAGALARAADDGTRVAVDAVSVPKVARLAEAGPAAVTVLFANLDEASALLTALGVAPTADDPVAVAVALRDAGPASVVVTVGARGAVVADAAGVCAVPAAPVDVVDVTGAGDALVAATLAGLVDGADAVDAVRAGVAAAALTVASPLSVLDPAAAGARPAEGTAEGRVPR